VCAARGLTGEQGVVIPAANVKHLMLRQDVVDAAAAGRFHAYPVETIDEALTLLAGIPAGEADAEGNFPEGSANFRVAARLMELVMARQAYTTMSVKVKKVREPKPGPEPKQPPSPPKTRGRRTLSRRHGPSH
jgi:hypothetical protein